MKKKPGSRGFTKGASRDGPPKSAPSGGALQRRPARESSAPHGPPDRTLRETQYLRNLVVNKTPVRIRLRDNAQVEGVVEYYDVNFLRLTRRGQPNLFIYKSDIKYLEERP